MYRNRSSRQNDCCRGCGNRCDNRSDWAFTPYWVTYQQRFLNVPMRVFNGAGYSSQDALESIADALHTDSHNGRNNCGGWNNDRSNCQGWRNYDSFCDCGCRSTYRSGGC